MLRSLGFDPHGMHSLLYLSPFINQSTSAGSISQIQVFGENGIVFRSDPSESPTRREPRSMDSP